MSWLLRYRISSYFRTSLWVTSVLGALVALVLVRILHGLEVAMGWESQFNSSTTMTLLATLASSMFTFIVFVCSALLLAVQLASAQLTPRLVGLVLQSRLIRFSLALFVFTFAFTLGALIRIRDTVPLLTPHVAVYSCLLSLCVFLFLVDRVCYVLRTTGAFATVARLGSEVITNVYPHLLSEPRGKSNGTGAGRKPEPKATILNLGEGVVLACDGRGLMTLAQRFDCLIEMVPQVGDFVAEGQPLFHLYGKGPLPPAAMLHNSVAIGPERTLEQDPAFAFRILVDIASKGLSPAINDPTTAVLALDQIEYLLRQLGTRRLDEGRRHDQHGGLRLVYRTPNWEDFVYLAVTEIRQFGATSIQIARRLKAMLENLIQYLPQERGPVLKLELDLLERSTKRFFADKEDKAMAAISDCQGVGGNVAGS